MFCCAAAAPEREKAEVVQDPVLLPTEEASKQPPQEGQKSYFDITVPKKEGGKWGFSFNVVVGRPFLRVSVVDDAGTFATYNETAPEAQKLVPELCITRVNEVTDAPGMSAIFKNPEVKEVKLRVCRPKAFQANIERDGTEPWGVEFVFIGDQLGLVFKTIKQGGVFDLYNKKADTPEDQNICIGDFIISSKEFRKGKDIFECMKNPATKTLDLKILRLPADALA